MLAQQLSLLLHMGYVKDIRVQLLHFLIYLWALQGGVDG